MRGFWKGNKREMFAIVLVVLCYVKKYEFRSKNILASKLFYNFEVIFKFVYIFLTYLYQNIKLYFYIRILII